MQSPVASCMQLSYGLSNGLSEETAVEISQRILVISDLSVLLVASTTQSPFALKTEWTGVEALLQ